VWIDGTGRLRLGPESAGADPGPVCYDAGGAEPTLTDANAVLGYINPHALAGGTLRIDADKARTVLEERIAEPLGLSVLEAAHGVYRLAAASMVRAVKAVSTYRGRDPRDFTLVAFGGNGPICAVEMASSLEIDRVVIPPAAGLFSAFGLLQSQVEYQTVNTFLARADETTFAVALPQAYAELEERALVTLREQGYAEDSVSIARAADMRYADQGYELTIPVSSDLLVPERGPELVEAFALEHVRTYGHRADGEPVDFVNLRVTAQVAANGEPALDFGSATRTDFDSSAVLEREVYFGGDAGSLATPVIRRAELSTQPTPGPLVVEEYDVTSIVPPGWRASLDSTASIVLTRER
jgi:N-methylhydantoinase A